jgi:hypothetical protein
MTVGYLVELDTLARPQEWTAAGGIDFSRADIFWDDSSVTFESGASYSARLGDDVILVAAVTQDGAVLAEVLSLDALNATLGAWFYDGATHVLAIRPADGGNPAPSLVLVTVIECLGLGVVPAVIRRPGTAVGSGAGGIEPFVVGESQVGGDATLGGSGDGSSGSVDTPGQDVVYETRIKALPQIATELGVGDLGAQSSVQLGELACHNEDAWWDRLLATRQLEGQVIRIYRGELAPGERALLTEWAEATMDLPSLTPETCRIPLVSIAKTLDKPVCPRLYTLDDYPDLDPQAAGQPIAKVWGPVRGAPCVRIASGRWKLSALRVEEITNAATKDGTAVVIDAVDLTLAEFTVDAGYDTEATLYVDAIGVTIAGPGSLLEQIALDAGIDAERIDHASALQADADRPVSVGLHVASGAIKAALDQVAQSALVDWYISRQNRLAMLARRVDMGNLLGNPAFALDTAGWFGVGLTLTRVVDGAGVPYAQLSKPADAEVHAYVTAAAELRAGHRYTLTAMVAADGPTDLTECRIALADFTGVVALSDPFVIPSRRWARIRADFLPADVQAQQITFARADIFWDDASIFFTLGVPELRLYPMYGRADALTVGLRAVELVEVIPLDDRNARTTAASIEPTMLSRVSCRYAHRLRDDAGPFAAVEAPRVRLLHPLAETRQVQSELDAEADALAVARAAMEFYGVQRWRLAVEDLEWDQPIELGAVLDLGALSRVPPIVDGSRLARVVKVSEAPPGGSGGAPVIALEALLVGEPLIGQAPLV